MPLDKGLCLVVGDGGKDMAGDLELVEVEDEEGIQLTWGPVYEKGEGGQGMKLSTSTVPSC